MLCLGRLANVQSIDNPDSFEELLKKLTVEGNP